MFSVGIYLQGKDAVKDQGTNQTSPFASLPHPASELFPGGTVNPWVPGPQRQVCLSLFSEPGTFPISIGGSSQAARSWEGLIGLLWSGMKVKGLIYPTPLVWVAI